MSGSRMNRTELLNEAHAIAEEYRGNLTLRQLYYQLVARGFSPNSQQDYKRIGDVLGTARMEGRFPFSWLLDRSRTIHRGDYSDHNDSVAGALVQAAGAVQSFPHWYLNASRWWGQRSHVSVWVEKEALAGVFEAPCLSSGVSWFACKGYPSLSALWSWVKAVERVVDASRSGSWASPDGWDDGSGLDEIVILYFGDHDPDGWEIPRSALRNVRQIARVEEIDLPPIRLERVALNMGQIRQYDPPPFPAKPTSSRFTKYLAEHQTDDAWELDALRPEVLTRLIRENVDRIFDADRHAEVQAHIEERREEMRGRMAEDGWLRSVL